MLYISTRWYYVLRNQNYTAEHVGLITDRFRKYSSSIEKACLVMTRVSKSLKTRTHYNDDGRVMAIFQLLYSQCHIWDIFGIPICFRPENQIHFPIDKALTVPK